MPPRPTFSPVWQRRLSKTALRRKPIPTLAFSTPQPIRYLHSTSSIKIPLPSKTLQISEPSGPALSALLSRLSLKPSPKLHNALLACLTHPSFVDPSLHPPILDENSRLTLLETEHNAILSSLGNSLMGMFVSEHLSTIYPLLPTSSLKAALTAYVGPSACFSVARELGVGVQGGGNAGEVGRGRGMNSAGLAVRWQRSVKGGNEDGSEDVVEFDAEVEKTPVARGFRRMMKTFEGVEGEKEVSRLDRTEKLWTGKVNFEIVVASAVKAFVGLIYQEEGIHAAREFTHAYFLSRHLDLRTLFNFKNPKHVLSSVVTKHLADAGVAPSSYEGRLESRVLASTGTNSLSPLFNVGIFLPSGLKLSEGHGSSLSMAEHRAAMNALHSIFLVRGDQPTSSTTSSIGEFGQGLPSSLYDSWGIVDGKIGGSSKESSWVYPGSHDVGGKEGVVGTGFRSAVGRRRTH